MTVTYSKEQVSIIRGKFEGYCDVGLGSAREALEEEHDVQDAYLTLSILGLELCGDCAIWHDNNQCSTSSPDDGSLYICDDCARERGLD